MNVELLAHTPDALDMLLYTKNTRLQGKESRETIRAMPLAEKLEILDGMMDTIQSPFEFVDYIFQISGVSRSFTHQLVRTRDASYAQESMRAVAPTQGAIAHDDRIAEIQEAHIADYETLIDEGYEMQQAREVLPTGIKTSIAFKVSLRELGRMAEVRLCKRTAGEYQEVLKLIKEEVVKVHSWADKYIRVYCAKYGTCCFPRYDKCPVQQFVTTIPQWKKDIVQIAWEESDHVANPEIKPS